MKLKKMTPEEATRLMTGTGKGLPHAVQVDGLLDFRSADHVIWPDLLHVNVLQCSGNMNIRTLPEKLVSAVVDISETAIEALPSCQLDQGTNERLHVRDDGQIVSVPSGGYAKEQHYPDYEAPGHFIAWQLTAQNMPHLEYAGYQQVPILLLDDNPNLRGIAAYSGYHISLTHDSLLQNFHPHTLELQYGSFLAEGCSRLTELPDGIGFCREVNIANTHIEVIPEQTGVLGQYKGVQTLELRGAPLKEFPVHVDESLQVGGQKVPAWIIREPEKLTFESIVKEQNLEVRRIMLEKYGYDRLTEHGKLLDKDVEIVDGVDYERSLYHMRIEAERRGETLEWLIVKVICPSTGRVYALNTPLRDSEGEVIKTCQHAVASTFQLPPEEYYPEAAT